MKIPFSRRTAVSLAVAIVAVSAVAGYFWDRNGNSLDFSDTDVKIVVSGSMAGIPRTQYDIQTIPVESMVFIHRVPSDPSSFYSSLKVGDVITFDYNHPVSKEDMVVTHRIVSISESNGVYTYTCKGDSIADDPTNGSVQIVTSSSGDIIGEVVGVSHILGQFVVFLSTGLGKFCLIIVPCLILIVSEVGNIIRVLRNGDGSENEDEVTESEPVSGPVEVQFTAVVPYQDNSDDGIFIRRS